MRRSRLARLLLVDTRRRLAAAGRLLVAVRKRWQGLPASQRPSLAAGLVLTGLLAALVLWQRPPAGPLASLRGQLPPMLPGAVGVAPTGTGATSNPTALPESAEQHAAARRSQVEQLLREASGGVVPLPAGAPAPARPAASQGHEKAITGPTGAAAEALAAGASQTSGATGPGAATGNGAKPGAEPTAAAAAGPTGPLVRPVLGTVLRGYGFVEFPDLGDYRLHSGLDLSAGPGEAVRSLAAGQVVRVEDDMLYGRTVVISHEGGWQSRYSGLGAAQVRAGAAVAAGAVLGFVGGPGPAELSLSSHLHLEIWKGNESLDPGLYLR